MGRHRFGLRAEVVSVYCGVCVIWDTAAAFCPTIATLAVMGGMVGRMLAACSCRLQTMVRLCSTGSLPFCRVLFVGLTWLIEALDLSCS